MVWVGGGEGKEGERELGEGSENFVGESGRVEDGEIDMVVIGVVRTGRGDYCLGLSFYIGLGKY